MASAARTTPESASAFRRGRWLRLFAFILLVSGTGLLIGILNMPGAWYAALNKPPFNPPDWVFAPVWTALFLMIGIAGFRTFEREPRGTAMKLWAAQMVLNFCWSPIFFSLHRIDIALAVVVMLLVAVLAFLLHQWSRDRLAAALFVPYAAWVGFAATLNAALFLLNQAG